MTGPILLTGFEPFNGSATNPAKRVVEELTGAGESLGVELTAALLPVDALKLPGILLPMLDQLRPAAVLHVGEAAGADKVRVERLAVNLLDFDYPDNTGRVIRDAPIQGDGPAARWATMDVRAAEAAISEAGLPVMLSASAGTFLCNQALYLSLMWSEALGGNRQVGFLHIPSSPEQVDSGERSGPGMEIERSVAAVQAVLGMLAG
ncbi:MAG: pyroglutamyl-peptidase I [Planctomycetota bacterium]